MTTMTDTNKGQRTFESRSEDAGEIVAALDTDDWDARDEATEALDSFALAVDVRRLVTITLGTGGPHDELQAVVGAGGGVESVTYVYYDWFGSDRFEQRLSPGDPLWRVAENYVEVAIIE